MSTVKKLPTIDRPSLTDLSAITPQRKKEMENSVLAETVSALRDHYRESEISFVVLEKWRAATGADHGIMLSIDGFEFSLSVRKVD